MAAGALACLAGIVLVMGDIAAAPAGTDPFAFFSGIATLDRADVDKLDRREPIVRILSAKDGEIGVFATARLDASPDALVAWTEAIAALKQGPFVPAIQRFSSPPVLADLDRLRLDDGDVDDIRNCRPGRCKVRLSDDDIAAMQALIATSGAGWRDAVQREFRRLLLARLSAYQEANPGISEDLVGYPAVDLGSAESFFYWSKERYGSAKPVVAVTHVTMIRPGTRSRPEVLVLGKEVSATHYRTASLGITAVVRDHARGVNYLVYVNRSHVDVLGGMFGGMKRKLIEGRIRSESSALLARVRDRLEGGPPPAAAEMIAQ
jgi:hypothetical protein